MPGGGRSSRKKRVVVVHDAVEKIFGSLELGLILDSGYYLDPIFFLVSSSSSSSSYSFLFSFLQASFLFTYEKKSPFYFF